MQDPCLLTPYFSKTSLRISCQYCVSLQYNSTIQKTYNIAYNIEHTIVYVCNNTHTFFGPKDVFFIYSKYPKLTAVCFFVI